MEFNYSQEKSAGATTMGRLAAGSTAAGSRRNIKRTILPMKEGGATAADNNSTNNWLLLLLRHMSSWRGENFSSLASAKKQYVYGKSSKTFVAFCLSFDGVQIEIEFRYGLNRAQSANLSPLSLSPLLCSYFQHTALCNKHKSAQQKANKSRAGNAPEIFLPHKS